MFKYTAKQIGGEVYTHFRYTKASVIEVFGWTNDMDNENLRCALYEALGLEVAHLEKLGDTFSVKFFKLKRKWFKGAQDKKNMLDAEQRAINIVDKIETLESIRRRLEGAHDYAEKDRRKYNNWSLPVDDLLLEDCKKYLQVRTLDSDREFEMEAPLTRWSDKAKNNVFKIEDDFTITAWRVGVSGFENEVNGHHLVGVSLSYLVHNFDTDQTLYQVGYNTETKNFERNWSHYSNGEYTPGGEVYYANIEDAVKVAKAGIKELNRKNRAIVKAANDALDRLAA